MPIGMMSMPCLTTSPSCTDIPTRLARIFSTLKNKLNITHVISIAVVINLLHEMGFDQGVLDVRYTIKHKNCQKPEVSHPQSVELKIKLKVFRWLVLALTGLALARLASRVIRLCKT